MLVWRGQTSVMLRHMHAALLGKWPLGTCMLQSDVWKKQGIVILDSARSWDGIRRQGIPNKCKGFFSQLLCSMTSSLLGPDEVDRELIKIF